MTLSTASGSAELQHADDEDGLPPSSGAAAAPMFGCKGGKEAAGGMFRAEVSEQCDGFD